MSDTRMERRWCTRVLLQTLICWTLIGLCCAGHRPLERGERQRYARHHDRWAQRIQHPTLHDQGTQRIEYPSVNDQSTQGVRYPSWYDRGQTVQFPSVNDSAASSQIKVKICGNVIYLVAEDMFQLSCRSWYRVNVRNLVGNLKTVISESINSSVLINNNISVRSSSLLCSHYHSS